jgi:hypothetical protein
LSSKGLSEIFSSCFFCCEVSVHLLQSDLALFLKFFFGIFAVRFLPFRLFRQTFGTLSRGRKGTIFFGKKNGGKMPAAGFLLSSLGVVLSSQHPPSFPPRSDRLWTAAGRSGAKLCKSFSFRTLRSAASANR